MNLNMETENSGRKFRMLNFNLPFRCGDLSISSMTTEKSNINNQIQHDDYELDQKQAAKILGVSTKTVRNWANKKPKKSGDPYLSKLMFLDANRPPSPRYSKSEVRELKKQLAEKKRAGKKPEFSAMEGGNSAQEKTSLELPSFDLSDFSDDQRPFVFMVHQANSERRVLQSQVNELTKKNGGLEKELKLKNRQIELIDDERKSKQVDSEQEKPDPEMIEHQNPQQSTETTGKYAIWVFVGLVLIVALFYLYLINPSLFQS